MPARSHERRLGVVDSNPCPDVRRRRRPGRSGRRSVSRRPGPAYTTVTHSPAAARWLPQSSGADRQYGRRPGSHHSLAAALGDQQHAQQRADHRDEEPQRPTTGRLGSHSAHRDTQRARRAHLTPSRPPRPATGGTWVTGCSTDRDSAPSDHLGRHGCRTVRHGRMTEPVVEAVCPDGRADVSRPSIGSSTYSPLSPSRPMPVAKGGRRPATAAKGRPQVAGSRTSGNTACVVRRATSGPATGSGAAPRSWTGQPPMASR